LEAAENFTVRMFVRFAKYYYSEKFKENLVRRGEIKIAYKMLVGKPYRRREGNRMNLKKQGVKLWTGFKWLLIGTSLWFL
jgi:hypothetical protein